jgi:hypothetical protein
LTVALRFDNHEVVCFNVLEKFNYANVVRHLAAVILDIDSPEGQLAKKALAERVLVNFSAIHVSAHDNFEDRLAAAREDPRLLH